MHRVHTIPVIQAREAELVQEIETYESVNINYKLSLRNYIKSKLNQYDYWENLGISNNIKPKSYKTGCESIITQVPSKWTAVLMSQQAGSQALLKDVSFLARMTGLFTLYLTW